MDAYTAFAKVYDKFMEEVPYVKWSNFIDFLISRYGISKPDRNAEDALESERNLVLDLGCGTGVLTKLMYEKGYDLIGVDISQEMLQEAMSKDEDGDILYICQDMCELDLYSTIGTVYSSCDSVNYLIEDEEIQQCFDRVSNFLYPGGLFIFDFNTVHKYKDVIGEATIAENDEDCSFIWDNYYDEENHINEYDLTLFIKDEESGLYSKEVENHYQRGYEIEEMGDFLERAGLKVLAFIDERALDSDYERILLESGMDMDNVSAVEIGITDDSQRVFVIAKSQKCD